MTEDFKKILSAYEEGRSQGTTKPTIGFNQIWEAYAQTITSNPAYTPNEENEIALKGMRLIAEEFFHGGKKIGKQEMAVYLMKSISGAVL